MIARISSDRALHDVLAPLVDEVRLLREELGQLRQAWVDVPPAKYLTVAHVAVLFEVSEATVRKRVNDGTSSHWRDGRQIRFGTEDLAVIDEWGRPKAPGRHLTLRVWREQSRKTREFLRNYVPG